MPRIETPYCWSSYAETSEVPLCDEDAAPLYYEAYPWAFDKYRQCLEVGPHYAGEVGTEICQRDFPMAIKPRYESGLARDVRLHRGPQPPLPGLSPREFWQEVNWEWETSPHWSVDFLWDGKAGPSNRPGKLRSAYWSQGVPSRSQFGHFLAWRVGVEAESEWWWDYLAEILRRFPGLPATWCNIELVGRRFIEIHLRPSAEFFPCYPRDLVSAIAASEQYDGDACVQEIVVLPRDCLTYEDKERDSWRQSLAYCGRQQQAGRSEW